MDIAVFTARDTRITFFAEDGWLCSIDYKGRQAVGDSALWRVRIHRGQSVRDLSPADMTDFKIRKNKENRMTLEWESPLLSVRVLLEGDPDGKIRWRIQASATDKETGLGRIVFPILNCNPISPEGKDDMLLLPWQNGWLIRDPVHSLLDSKAPMPFWLGRGDGKYENEYPAQYSYQFAALYAPQRDGLYLAAEDGDARIKTMGFYQNGGDGLDFAVTHYPEHMGALRHYALPYDFVLRFFEGGWEKAVDIYRPWALGQKWCRTKIADQAMPENLKSTDLWRINHTSYALGMRTREYFDTSVMLRDAVGCRLGLHWYGWNMGEHDVNYPDYIDGELRARGWPEALAQWNRRFDGEGIVKIPYVNARLWDVNTPGWRDGSAPPAALRDEKGQLYEEPWKNNNLRPMCPATAIWQDKVAAFSLEVLEDLGFDGLYLDQIASFNATLCFDPAHPHPAGGGSWWNDSYHAMMGTLRGIAGDDFILTTESCCESYIDSFNLVLILDTCMFTAGFPAVVGPENCESVPLFNMIYAGRALSYGSVCRFSDPIDEFEFKFIRNILWGLLPTVEGIAMDELTRPDAGVYLDVIRRGVAFYRDNREILWHGCFRAVPQVACDPIELTWTIGGRRYRKQYPGVLAVVREDPTNGSVIHMLYNLHVNVQRIVLGGNKIEIEPKTFTVI